MTQIIDLGKLRFNFAGQWDANTQYELNDVVKYGGNVYCYIYPLKDAGNLPTDATHWALMVKGLNFAGAYNNAAAYHVGDAVAYGAVLYICVADVTGTVPPNPAFWSQLADGISFQGAFLITTAYKKNDLVTYGAATYVAKQDTTGNLPTTAAFWTKLIDGVSAQGVYNAGTAYVPNDVVAYGANLYRAKVEVTGIVPTADATKWELYVGGMAFKATWSAATAYKAGESFTYGANLYRAKMDVNAGDLPTNAAKFDLLSTGFRNAGAWLTATSFFLNDVVTYGGNTYIALVGHASTTFGADLAAGKWQKFNGGIRWQGTFVATTAYLANDIVADGTSTFLVVADYTSGASAAADFAAGKLAMLARGQANVPNPVGAADGKVITTLGGAYALDFAKPKMLVISADRALEDGIQYSLDSTNSSFTLTLPANPAIGARVKLDDGGGMLQAFPVTVLRNGQNFNGVSDDLLLNSNGIALTLTYINALTGWRIS